MEFRLLFEGELLPSAGSNKRAKEKHAIRRALHPQLRRLWQVHNNLLILADRAWLSTIKIDSVNESSPLSLDERVVLGLAELGRRSAKAGYNLVPLVTRDMELRCSIDITLLRPEENRLVFQRGDIDGQLKTLFDALRVPHSASETGNTNPTEDEDPLFCLLEDDNLVTDVSVKTDIMLLLPNRREVKANDAHATIHVKLQHRHVRTFDNYFG